MCLFWGHPHFQFSLPYGGIVWGVLPPYVGDVKNANA
jgi:hypothetical protein